MYHKAIIQKTCPFVFPESFCDIFELTSLKRKEPKCPVAKLISFYLKFVNNLKHWLCSRKQVIKIGGVRAPVLTLLDCLLCRRQLGNLGQAHMSTFALCSSRRPQAILSCPFPACISHHTVHLAGPYLHTAGNKTPGTSPNLYLKSIQNSSRSQSSDADSFCSQLRIPTW